jgi:uncharacterized protein (DUF433 family)
MSTTVRIVKTPDVLHGKPRIEGTRVGAFEVGHLVRRQGWSVGRVAQEFDLDHEQATAAVEYYDEYPELMETLRTQREAGRRSVRADGRTT